MVSSSSVTVSGSATTMSAYRRSPMAWISRSRLWKAAGPARPGRGNAGDDRRVRGLIMQETGQLGGIPLAERYRFP